LEGIKGEKEKITVLNWVGGWVGPTKG
jgi:hypothetical protein